MVQFSVVQPCFWGALSLLHITINIAANDFILLIRSKLVF